MAKILVIGDLILDHYVYGICTRISPEAPIPVLAKTNSKYTVGGAGNVAVNCSLRTREVVMLGAISDDQISQIFKHRIGLYNNIKPVYLKNTKTTLKSRYFSSGQQILRVDDETVCDIGFTLIQNCIQSISDLKYVIVSDYAKGVCSDIQCVIEHNPELKFIVDPKGDSFKKYTGAYILTPNELEFKRAVYATDDVQELIYHARIELTKLDIEYMVITRGSKGALVIWKDGSFEIPAEKVEISDVTGAGDVFISCLACGLLNGQSVVQACKDAVLDASYSVTKVGTVAVPPKTKTPSVDATMPSNSSDLAKVDHIRKGKTLAITNGCFDLLHAGHVDFLSKCAALADVLVVLLNSDQSIKRLKGTGRPINSVACRRRVLEGIKGVDLVIEFDADTPLELIKKIKPDYLVKGGDYSNKEIVGASHVISYGGEVVVIPIKHEISTTKLVQKIIK